MQSRRTTALHPTRSGIIGLIAAAVGIDKRKTDEADQLAQFQSLRVTPLALPRRDRRATEILMQRLEDYHSVTGIRRKCRQFGKCRTPFELFLLHKIWIL
ncbi:MAG TPA: hypothetical protein DCE44_17920 [Verrucomicrobiales bacterium]|nr:hypothetical protein [Verrucomicrobiales bacterium]